VYITTGLEFTRDVAIDTHFISRGRIMRMAQTIATNPQCIGIGLEEDTGVLFTEGNQIEVVGSGLIVIVDGKGIRPSAQMTPGRMNLFRLHDKQLLVDYAHNPAALEVLGAYLQKVAITPKSVS